MFSRIMALSSTHRMRARWLGIIFSIEWRRVFESVARTNTHMLPVERAKQVAMRGRLPQPTCGPARQPIKENRDERRHASRDNQQRLEELVVFRVKEPLRHR